VNLIRKYFLEGRKPTAISKYLNISKSTVYRIISQLKIQKRINKQEKRGRPKKLQKKHKKFLRNLISSDDTLSLQKLQNRLKEHYDLQVSKKSLSKSLKNMGFSYIKNKKAYLTADQKIRRVQWAMEHLHMMTGLELYSAMKLVFNLCQIDWLDGERKASQSKLEDIEKERRFMSGQQYLSTQNQNLSSSNKISQLNSICENLILKSCQNGKC
jgi:transposase